MKVKNPIRPDPAPPAKKRVSRARSLRTTRPFNVAALFCSFHYVALIITLVTFSFFLVRTDAVAVKWVLCSLFLTALTWVIAAFKRREARCPLCKGTPMIESGAIVNLKAQRVFPFNYGTTATLSIIATQGFRCMYCGSTFDMLKVPSFQRGLLGDHSDD
jgi:hypothetical protein